MSTVNYWPIETALIPDARPSAGNPYRPPGREEIMRITWLSLLLAPAFAALLGASASAEVLCGVRDRLVEQLRNQYQEVPQARGLTTGGDLIEVFASPQGTWTILLTYPNGQSCLVAAGEAWERLTPPEKDRFV